VIGLDVGSMGEGKFVSPIKYLSTAAAVERPSAIAQTINDCPLPASPQTNTPSAFVAKFSSRAIFPLGSKSSLS
jgi:hypothetical protein